MKMKAEPIGECPCTQPGCDQVLKVFRYQERSARPSMFKGKFYSAPCPTHGKVVDASSSASQEHVLQRGTIWGATAPKTAAAEPAPPTLPRPESTPRPQPQSAPAPPRPPAPDPEPEAPTSGGWNLWDWWAQLMS